MIIPHTFTERQLKQLRFGLQSLLDKGVLTEEEVKAAKRLLEKIRVVRGEGHSLIHVAEEDEEFLNRVMAALWSGRGSGDA